MRVGHGYDAHAFTDGVPLILGGVNIPYPRGLLAHSDGDAVVHALCDALLGAAALGDIGHFFPDTDRALENIESRIMLRKVYMMLEQKNYKISNVDITILAQEPKISAHISDMRKHLATDLHIDISFINIKSTTTEQMGFVGRREGIAVYAVALLE